MLPPMQLAPPVQLASQLTCAIALTWHSPPETVRPQVTCAVVAAMSAALMPATACLQASVVSSSAEPPPSGPMAVHVSICPRSVAMPMHAVRTLVSIDVATLWSCAAAVTNAFVLPSMVRPPTADTPAVNSSHP